MANRDKQNQKTYVGSKTTQIMQYCLKMSLHATIFMNISNIESFPKIMMQQRELSFST